MTQSLSGLGGVQAPSIVGQEKPEWDIPGRGISERLRGYLMRVDAGESGLNAAEDMPPEVIDEFRRMVNAGVLKPRNQAASNIARSRGGLQAGDMTLLGPMIDGMPEGFTPEYWGIVLGRAQQVADERIAIMDRTGYFEGVPTLERQRIEADIANNIARTEIERSLADNTIRQTDMDEAYRRDAMAQDMRQNIISQFGYDPGPMGAAGAAMGNEQASMMEADGTMPMPGSPQQKAQMERYTATQGGKQLGGSTQVQAQGAPPPTGADGQPVPAPGTPEAAQAAQAAQASASGGAPAVAGQIPPGMPGGPPVTPGGGQYGQVGAGGTRPNMTTQVGSDIGWQFVDGRWQQTLGGRQQDLAQQQQAFLQQQTQAELASNPRNYIQAQMAGGSRGGLGGFAPNNQVDPTTGMPYSQAPGMPGAQQPWPAKPVPWGMPGGDGVSISPVNPATGLRFDESTGQYTSAPMPTAQENMDGRMAMFQQQGGLPAKPVPWGMPDWTPGAAGQPGAPTDGAMPVMPVMPVMPGADGLPQGQDTQWHTMANQAQQGAEAAFMGAQQAGQMGGMQKFQAPGMGGYGMTGLQRQPMAQPLQAGQPTQAGMPGMGANGMMGPQGMGAPGQNVAVGAFSQALNKNRLVPKSGAMGQQGAMMSMGGIQQATNPQKWRAQDFMRGNFSEKQQALGTASAAGFSDEDTQSMLGKSLPTFKAPGAGAMM